MGYDLRMLKEPEFQISGGDWETGGEGMTMLCAIMERAGVIDTDCEIRDCAEPWPPAGMKEPRASEVISFIETGGGWMPGEPEPTAAEIEACRRYLKAREIFQQQRSPRPDRVHWFKFDGNDGMHILPEECALIADALDRLLEDPPEDLAESIGWDDGEDGLIEWIEDWRDYNRVAATHGGYRVS